MGIRNVLNPDAALIPIASVEVVEVHIGNTVLTISVGEGGTVDISCDRGGLLVLPKAANRLLVQPNPL